jgi:hypothetical protein
MMRRLISTIVILFVLASILGKDVIAQTNWRSIGNFPGYYFLTGYFWNAKVGVAGDVHQLIYTRNGISWNNSSTSGLPVMASRMSMRCFDGKTVYAALLDNFGSVGGFAELWSSTDSGASWNRIQQIPLTTAYVPPFVNGVDVYWDYATNTPVLCGTIVAQLGKYNLVASADDQAILPYFSWNGGRSWYNGTLVPSSTFSYGGGYGAWVDTVKHIFYACAEDGPPHIMQSLDSGLTWSFLPVAPPSPFIIDDLEGASDKLFVQGSTGVCMTSNGGGSWKSLGGPLRTQDDTRFCVFGCQGLAVVAFDDKGGIWMANDWDAESPNDAVFSTTGYECDSSTLIIPLDSSYAPGPMAVSLSDDDSVFTVQSASKLISPGGQILIRFHPRDVQNHTAKVAIAPLGYPGCDVVRNISGKASLQHAMLSAPMPRVGCQPQLASFTVNNPNCDSLHISSTITSSPLLTISSFDSTIGASYSIPFECSPLQQSGVKSYTIQIHGTYEPSGFSYDTIFPVAVQYAHVTSLLQSSVARIDFAPESQCHASDTDVVLENFGCDTLRVSLTQSLASQWSITPSFDSITLLPGDKDTVHVHFASVVPGSYDARLSYPYTGPHTDITVINLHAEVLALSPSVLLPVRQVDLGTRSICEPDSMIEIALSNTGCDTIRIANANLSTGIAFQLLNSVDTILPPDGILHANIQYHPMQRGVASQLLTFRISRLDGSRGRDTAVSFSTTIVRGSALISATTNAIDVGETYVCEERDTMIVLQNSGCDSLCIDSMSIAPTYFEIIKSAHRGGTATTVCLGPGDRDTLYLRSAIDTVGAPSSNVAALTIVSDATIPVAPILLTRGISYPAPWSLRLYASDSSSDQINAIAGTEIAYRLVQRGNLPRDVTESTMEITYIDDVLQFLRAEGCTISNYRRSADGRAHLLCTVAPVGPDSLLATLHFLPYVSRNNRTAIEIDNINFQSSLSRPNECIAAVTTRAGAFEVGKECGSALLTNLLQGSPIVIDAITPNPAHNEISVTYFRAGAESADVEIVVEDMLGRCVIDKTVSSDGENNRETLNLSTLAEGVYQVRILSSGSIAHGRFVKQ